VNLCEADLRGVKLDRASVQQLPNPKSLS
jgi:hypothetical protein